MCERERERMCVCVRDCVCVCERESLCVCPCVRVPFIFHVDKFTAWLTLQFAVDTNDRVVRYTNMLRFAKMSPCLLFSSMFSILVSLALHSILCQSGRRCVM